MPSHRPARIPRSIRAKPLADAHMNAIAHSATAVVAFMNEDVAAEAGLTTAVLATGAVRDHRGEPPGGVEPPRSGVRAGRSGIGTTSPFAVGSAKVGSPPDLVVREGDHGCRLRGHQQPCVVQTDRQAWSSPARGQRGAPSSPHNGLIVTGRILFQGSRDRNRRRKTVRCRWPAGVRLPRLA
jgi:hypothetical protein